MDYIKLLELREKVYYRIQDVLTKDDFELSIKNYVGIHEALFTGLLYNNGHFRKNNLEKDEDILNGESVDYPDYHTIPTFLRFAFIEEKNTDLKKMSRDEIIRHVALFMAELWRIHPFDEGNTRATTVYIEKYLKSLGFSTDNDIFKNNSEYVRNALVRANYSNEKLGIVPDIEPLVTFLSSVVNHTDSIFDNNKLYVQELFEKSKIKKRKKYNY